jgi:RNA polymerase sigma-70 factor, ECF subfamily
MDAHLAFYSQQRQRLWGLAYRNLGTVADSDDVMQEVWLRWNDADRDAIANPPGWLTTVTAHLALDRLRVVQRERSRYVGPWLPDPIRKRDMADPADSADSARIDDAVVDADSIATDVTLGLMMVLERLDPIERVVLVLKDVFGESFSAIAEVVQKDAVACRQIAVRARRRVHDQRRQRHRPTEDERTEVAIAFSMAASTGNVDALIALLSSDAVLISDGGEHRHAARRPVVTPERIARFITNLFDRMPTNYSMTGEILNGEQAYVWSIPVGSSEKVDGALVLQIDSNKVTGIFIQVNETKLQHLLS